MTQQELKAKIEDNTIDDSPLILKFVDNDFICMQYAKTIAKNKGLKIIDIAELSELDDIQDDTNIFDAKPEYLYLYKVDDLTGKVKESYKNLIVICKKISSNNNDIDYVAIASLVNWQIEEFLKMRLPGLIEDQIKWLCQITKYNIYRLDNEAKKLEIFSKEYQRIIFDQINRDSGYRDLNNLTIFDLTNAIMRKDTNTIKRIFESIEFIDIEPVGLATIFRSQIRKIIDIQLNPSATAQSLGMNPKQFAAIKYNSLGMFNQSQLINMYEFITGIDYKLKAGELQFNKDSKENNYNFIDYIVTKLIILGSSQKTSL